MLRLENSTERSTVDNDRRAGDVASSVARQQESRPCQLFRPAPTAESGCFGEDLFLLVAEDLVRKVCQERTGREAVHRNIERSKIQRSGSSQAQQRRLRCAVGATAFFATQTQDRGDVN